MMKLNRLKIERYRNVRPGVELRFHDGLNVLLGQNGTGKTTLLNLISMILRADFSELAREEFAFEFDLRLQDLSISVRFVNRMGGAGASVRGAVPWQAPEAYRPRMDVEVRAPDVSEPDRMVYDDGWQRGGQAGRKDPDIPGCFQPRSLVDALIGMSGPRGTTWHLWHLLAGQAYRFDESLDFFRKIIGSKDFPGEQLTVFFVSPEGAMKFSGFASDARALPRLPNEVTEKLLPPFQKDPWPSEIVIEDREIPFLHTVVQLMGLVSAQLKIDVLEESRQRGRVRLGNLSFRFRREDGDVFTHDTLSYGQKRMLIFYYYLALNPAVVVADELVNGLHHQWITACVEALAERQAFLTSQNPLLLDYIAFSSAQEARASFILCRSVKEGGRSQMLWGQMTEEDATELFDAYRIGVEHVSEILQSRGLW